MCVSYGRISFDCNLAAPITIKYDFDERKLSVTACFTCTQNNKKFKYNEPHTQLVSESAKTVKKSDVQPFLYNFKIN